MPMSSTAMAGLRSRASASARSPLRAGDDVETVAPKARRHEQQDVLVVVGDETPSALMPRAPVGRGAARPAKAARCGRWCRLLRALDTEIVPPCASTIARAMNKPRPVPGTCCATTRDDRKKRSKTRSRLSGAEADAGVAYLEHRAIAFRRDPDLDAAAVRRELDRVPDQVVEQLEDAGPCRASISTGRRR